MFEKRFADWHIVLSFEMSVDSHTKHMKPQSEFYWHYDICFQLNFEYLSMIISVHTCLNFSSIMLVVYVCRLVFDMPIVSPQYCQNWYFLLYLLFFLASMALAVFPFRLYRLASGGFISVSLSPQVSFFLFIVFVVYTMLPFSMREAIIASVLTSASHTLVLSVCLSTTADHMEPIVWQVK